MSTTLQRMTDMYHTSAIVHDDSIGVTFVDGGIDDGTGCLLAYAQRAIRPLGRHKLVNTVYGVNVVCTDARVVVYVQGASA